MHIKRTITAICFTAMLGVCSAEHLPGFTTSPYFDEQIMNFGYAPGVKILINAPSEAEFSKSRPTRLELYALPNGNSTAWTAGKLPAEGDDWHYHIQHIAAQTRYIRKTDKSRNFVTVYLEADKKSWGAWRKDGDRRDTVIKEIADSLMSLFARYSPQIGLNSHSGGGNFIFGFMDAVDSIPDYVSGISFLDSSYNWDDSRYGDKLCRWLEASPGHKLFAACYDDANALFEGKPFISREGGTFYRTDMMRKCVQEKVAGLKWTETEDDSVIYRTADKGRIQFYSRKNPERKIYHTILVERNGYIQSVLAGTPDEGKGYCMMGARAYDLLRQDSIDWPLFRGFGPRKDDAPKGREFTEMIFQMPSGEVSERIVSEICAGNIPDAMRQPVYVTDSIADCDGCMHLIRMCILPDIGAVGTDDDFIRVSVSGQAARRIAEHYHASLPTDRLSAITGRYSRKGLTLIADEILVDGKPSSLRTFLPPTGSND